LNFSDFCILMSGIRRRNWLVCFDLLSLSGEIDETVRLNTVDNNKLNSFGVFIELKSRATMCRDFAESSRFGGTRCLDSSVINSPNRHA
jgi:hypothetical protein